MPSREVVPGLASRLQSARESCGLTLRAAAVRSGVHIVSIARFEKNRRAPTIATLCKLAEAYGITPGELLPPVPQGRNQHAVSSESPTS